MPLLIYMTITLWFFSWSQQDISKKSVLLNIHHREWMVNWLRPPQENFYFMEDAVSIIQGLMGRISGVNIHFYLKLIRCLPQSFVLCGKATKLREAALFGKGILPTTPYNSLFLSPQPPAPSGLIQYPPQCTSSTPVLTISWCSQPVLPSFIHSVFTVEKCWSTHSGVWSSFLPHYHPYPKAPRAPKFQSSYLLTTKFRDNNNFGVTSCFHLMIKNYWIIYKENFSYIKICLM